MGKTQKNIFFNINADKYGTELDDTKDENT